MFEDLPLHLGMKAHTLFGSIIALLQSTQEEYSQKEGMHPVEVPPPIHPTSNGWAFNQAVRYPNGGSNQICLRIEQLRQCLPPLHAVVVLPHVHRPAQPHLEPELPLPSAEGTTCKVLGTCT